MLSIILPFLPVLFILGLTRIFFQFNFSFFNLRRAFISSIVLFGVVVYVSTEFLGAFRLISPLSFSLLWGLLVGGILCYLLFKNQKVFDIKISMHQYPFDWFLIAVIVLYVSLITVIVFIAPPNTWDSMTYHMSRVMHWIQNKSVNFYPTAITRQLWANPFAEYSILHFQLLAQSDRWANSIQWLAMITSTVTVSSLIKVLGYDKRVQLLGSFFCVLLPMGILQASSTQNDYVVAMWLSIFIYFIFKQVSEFHWFDLIMAGVVLGLGCLTKGTMYIFALPFIIFLIVKKIKTAGVWKAFITGLILACGILLFNTAHYIRNWELGRDILSPTQEAKDLRASKISLATIYSNILRSSTLHLITSPFKPVNEVIKKGIIKAHDVFGIDLHDPSVSTGPSLKSLVLVFDEDYAGNFLHFILWLVLFVLFIVRKKWKTSGLFEWFLILGMCAWFLFIILLKWQIWQSRLLLPLFVLGSASLAIMCSQLLGRKKTLLWGLVIIFSLYSLVWLLRNNTRRLISSRVSIFNLPREDVYFMKKPFLKEVVQKIADFTVRTHGCSEVGIHLGGDSWEYPWWVFFNKFSRKPVRIEHLNLPKIEGLYPNGKFDPCAVVYVGEKGAKATYYILNNIPYINKGGNNVASIFIDAKRLLSPEKVTELEILLNKQRQQSSQ